MTKQPARDPANLHRLATVLVARPEGQLGNRIFQAAAFQAAAWEGGFSLMNPALGPYAEFFPALAEDFFCRPGRRLSFGKGGRLLFCRLLDALTAQHLHPLWSGRSFALLDIVQSHDEAEQEFDLCGAEFSKMLTRHRLIVMKGWKFRAHAALKSRREDVVRLFTPHQEILAEVERCVARAKAGNDLLVGLHVRRGDYANWLGGRFYYDLDAYAAWIRMAQALWPERRVGFLICSNENVAPLLTQPSVQASSGPGAPITDIYALAACDFLIGPPSTFTLWASYYGGAPLHMLMEKDQKLHLGGFTHHNRF
ncbi:MAG: alpha-1,2-fucosyltransferase [bacterium]